MPTPLSGKDGTIKKDGAALVADVVYWNFSPKSNVVRYASDKTSGHKVGFGTVKDFDADATIVMPSTGNMEIGVGSTFTIQFHGDDSGNNYISAPVEVAEVPYSADINNGEDVERQVTLIPRGPATYYGLYWWGAGSSGQA